MQNPEFFAAMALDGEDDMDGATSKPEDGLEEGVVADLDDKEVDKEGADGEDKEDE